MKRCGLSILVVIFILLLCELSWRPTVLTRNEAVSSSMIVTQTAVANASHQYIHREDRVIYMPEMTIVLDERDERRDAVFFTETSNNGIIRARFACAIESAAVAYSNADIYLLVLNNEQKLYYCPENKALFKVLEVHKHVRVLFVDLYKLFKGSPLEKFHQSGKLNTSKFLATHTSDIVRMFVTCKYGGRYIDIDIITVKNVTEKNYLITEMDNDNCYLANGFFGIQKDFELCPWMLERVAENFDGQEWYANGPSIWTNAMLKFGGVTNVGNLTSKNLKQFRRLNYHSLFPIQWFELSLYFDESKRDVVMQRLKNTTDLIGMHVGNNAVKHWKAYFGSQQPYVLLAQKYCPLSYRNCAQKLF